jgi:pseudouridine synthase
VYDLLPSRAPWIFPVGRLDKDTSGLLLLTNDTRFGERVTNPAEKVPKSYLLDLDRPLSDEDRGAMESGMTLRDGTRLSPALIRLRPGGPARHEVIITEGKNRQIRRMCDQLGYTVRALKRVSIGPIGLGALKDGEVRRLSEGEIAAFISPHMG